MGTFNSRSFAQRGFPTFAAAGTATGLTANTIYHVGGKTTVGDTYAGLFTYVPDDSTAASDDVIVVTGGRLKRQSFDSIVQGTPGLSYGPDTFGTITTGGTSQQVLASSASPRDVRITNSGTQDLMVAVGATPTSTNGQPIYPGGQFTTRTDQAINVWGSTTGQTFVYSVSLTASVASMFIGTPVSTNAGDPNWANKVVSVTSTATVILIARSGRSQATITNPIDSNATIAYGPAGLTYAASPKLAPGESKSIPTTAAIYGITQGGQTATVEAEETWT